MQIKVGSVAGTGAAINVSIGFKPKYVKVYNHNDAGAVAPAMEWFEGMPAGHGLKTTNTAHVQATANGISQYAGSDSAPEGFTIGADADVNVSGETVFYMAVG